MPSGYKTTPTEPWKHHKNKEGCSFGCFPSSRSHLYLPPSMIYTCQFMRATSGNMLPRIVLSATFATFFVTVTSVFDQHSTPKSASNEKVAGIRARLTPKGIQYIVKAFVKAIASEISTRPIVLIPQVLTGNSDKVVASNISLELQHVPDDAIVTQVSNAGIQISIRSVNITFEADCEGNVTDEEIKGHTHMISTYFPLILVAKFGRSGKLMPEIETPVCKVGKSPRMTIIHEQKIGSAAIKRLHTLLSLLTIMVVRTNLCSRVREIVTDRINQELSNSVPQISISRLAGIKTKADVDPSRLLDSELSIPRSLVAMMGGLNMSRTEDLVFDYSLISSPLMDINGIEIDSSGEISVDGKGGSPFESTRVKLPHVIRPPSMLHMIITDYVPNSLFYHGHKIGLFDLWINRGTPHVGVFMRTTCGFGDGPLFCLGDILSTLQHYYPNRNIAMFFRTTQAPLLIFSGSRQGSKFKIVGKLSVYAETAGGKREHVGDIVVDLDAFVLFRLSHSTLRPKINMDEIKLTSLRPDVLNQDELNDAGLLGRDLMQRVVNSILSEGIPVPQHTVFKITKARAEVLDRAILLISDFHVNTSMIKRLIRKNKSNANDESREIIKA
ncbi:hypothetical protein AB6A40_001735 [Gnathostoma spinigerum]|uniref:Lipid-binding serum glycoprotein C-terminal domain-containing protein n=1 Tax=Gnathostoma spinigerum TaxID=75299 RepID=A0ABD6ECB7_9BILA